MNASLTDMLAISENVQRGNKILFITEDGIRFFKSRKEAYSNKELVRKPHSCIQVKEYIGGVYKEIAQIDQPRFENVSCSQCGREFGPGNHGYSNCLDHCHFTDC